MSPTTTLKHPAPPGTVLHQRLRSLPLDLFSPVSLLLAFSQRLAQHSEQNLFLFESCGPDLHQARYSFLGLNPSEILSIQNGQLLHSQRDAQGLLQQELLSPAAGQSALQALRAHLQQALSPVLQREDSQNPQDHADLPPFCGGYVGYLGYDCVQYLEAIQLPASADTAPEACLLRCEELIVFDHLKNRLLLVVSGRDSTTLAQRLDALQAQVYLALQTLQAAPLPSLQTDREGPAPTGVLGEAAFVAAVAEVQAAIAAGECFQTVLSERFVQPLQARPVDVYRVLRSLSPSPYLFYLQVAGRSLMGASPEMLLRVDNPSGDGPQRLSTCPIAGTRPRGKDPASDAALAAELLACAKEQAEHLMLVDLGRNDLGKVARPGSVKVSRFQELVRYSHVMHLVSLVEAELDPAFSPFEALLACFPAGTLSGAPKVSAMQLIARLEPLRRGWYGGCVFYLGFDGQLDSAITIRSLEIAAGRVSLQAGAGIVADSVPSHEYKEIKNKTRALFQVLQAVNHAFAD